MTAGLDLAGRAVILTGAGSGLGRAYALRAARAGAAVVVNDLHPDAVAAVVDEVGRAGGIAVGVEGSVADPAVAERLVAACTDRFGRLDGLVNNAGVRPEGLSWDEPPDVTTAAVEVNLLGTIFCGAAALREMVAAGHGSVVNICSRAQLGVEASATYAATKGAVASLTYSWALDVPSGVRINAVAPHARGTGTRRPGAVFRPEEPGADAMAPLVVYLLSDAAEHVNGQVLRLTGRPDGLHLGVVEPPCAAATVTGVGWDEAAIAAAFDVPLRPTLAAVGAGSRW